MTSVAPDGGEVCTNAPDNTFAVRDEGSGAIHFCTSQGLFTGPENVQVLQYGQVLTVGRAYCKSAEDGVTCALTDSTAFFLSREQNHTYR